MEISHQITKDILLGGVDDLILLSGDGDFYSLLNYAKNEKNIGVKVFAVVPAKTSKLYKKGNEFSITYLSQIIEKVCKRKALAEHERSERVLFDDYSVANEQKMSSDGIMELKATNA